MIDRAIKKTCIIGLSIAALAGCSSLSAVENRELVNDGLAYQAQYRAGTVQSREAGGTIVSQSSARINSKKCTVQQEPVAVGISMPIDQELLSAGDMIHVLVGEDQMLSGNFEVSQDGTIKLPHLGSVRAAGKDVQSVEANIRKRLVADGLYHQSPRVSVRITDFAPARVHVAGAVFEPSTVRIGALSAQDINNDRQATPGGLVDGRRLSRALQSAGGVRPDANLARVTLTRQGKTRTIDVRPALNGGVYEDIILLSGDVIDVPSRDCFQEALVKPSSITTPGVKVFMSNLTKPADANALSAVGKDARELRYGTRFIQAIVGMNCMGGTKWINANRSAVLFSRNPITGESVVIERKIEKLLRRKDRDEHDPYIMPGDALACYDSEMTNIFDLAKGLGGVAAALALSSL